VDGNCFSQRMVNSLFTYIDYGMKCGVCARTEAFQEQHSYPDGTS
jgi:hypothetical protein